MQVTALNLLPVAVALSIDPDQSHYTAGYFGELAAQLAGMHAYTYIYIHAYMCTTPPATSGSSPPN